MTYVAATSRNVLLEESLCIFCLPSFQVRHQFTSEFTVSQQARSGMG
jgi:hypothetical protein